MSPMRRAPRACLALTASAILLAGLALAAGEARASCSVEGCSFIRSGIETRPDRVSFGFRFEGITQDELWEGSSAADLDHLIEHAFESGGQHNELELFTKTRSFVVEGRAWFHPRFFVTGSLPYHEREHQHMLVHAPFYNPAFVDTWKYEGLGDAIVLGHYRVPTGWSSTALQAQGGVKLPTGRRHVPDEDKLNFGLPSSLEPSVRPGTGSTDWIAGGLVTQALPWRRALPVTANLEMRWNGKGTDDYKVGDDLHAGLGIGYAPFNRLALLAQLNYSSHGPDEPGHEGEAAHTSMRALYVTPGVNVTVAPMVSLYALYQFRAWVETDEAAVVAKDHFMIGASFSPGR